MNHRLIFFDGTLERGGAERVISILSREMVTQGNQNVEILLYYDKAIAYELHPDITVTFIERETHSKRLLKNLWWMRNYIKRNADVVVSFLAPFNMLALVANLGSKTPLIVADRNDPRKVPSSGIMRRARDFLYRFADAVVLQNERNRDYFSKAVQKKSAIILNPVNLGEYNGIALTKEKRKRIVFVGRIIRQKNPQMLLDAFHAIHDDYPDYSMTYYGDGDLYNTLKERIAICGLADSAFMPGAVTNVFEVIADAELFVMTSDYEGMPNALIEAMCLGLPVISTKVSGATDVIENGQNGLLIDCNDTVALADAMRSMLDDVELRKKCGTNAAKLSEKLSVDIVYKQWLDLIQSAKAGMSK